jgi:hypothetical protein
MTASADLLPASACRVPGWEAHLAQVVPLSSGSKARLDVSNYSRLYCYRAPGPSQVPEAAVEAHEEANTQAKHSAAASLKPPELLVPAVVA